LHGRSLDIAIALVGTSPDFRSWFEIFAVFGLRKRIDSRFNFL
jgi:hypothetical protein